MEVTSMRHLTQTSVLSRAKSGYAVAGPLLKVFLAMFAISGFQYAWTLFVKPLADAHHWTPADIQWGYTIFINLQAFPLLLYGYLADRYGSRNVMLVGSVFVALSWTLNSFANTLNLLYLGQALAGFGTGLVIAGVYGKAVRQYTKKRGFAAGAVSAGYALGAIIAFQVGNSVITNVGYEWAFVVLGLGQGGIAFVAAFSLSKDAPHQDTDTSQTAGGPLSTRDWTSVMWTLLEKCLTGLWLLWVYRKTVLKYAVLFAPMYAMFALVSAGGSMVTAQFKPIADDLGVTHQVVTLFGIPMSALLWANTLDRLTNAASRPFFGWLSDILGRELTLCLAFALEAVAVYAFATYAHDPVMFVLLSGLVFFAWGEIFSIFPSLCTDIYGEKWAMTNYGLLYSAKGAGAFLVPIASAMSVGGDWSKVFYVCVVFDLVAAALAILLYVLRRNVVLPR